MHALLSVSFPLTVRIAMVFWFALFGIPPAFGGDVIHFKDGMRTLCHGRAWEEKDEVHCEYGGALLIYPKKDVAQIEKSLTTETASQADSIPLPGAPPQSTSSSPEGTGPFAKTPAGVWFYDPRRAKKYWSSTTSHHDSYPDALSALAIEFNRPPSWIEGHMGESNDLAEIRNNLAALSRVPAPPTGNIQLHAAAAGIEFYNPRRPKKYWTAPDAQHDTLDQAIESLAAEFGRSKAWVELHMGETNDLEQIRRSLAEAQQASTHR